MGVISKLMALTVTIEKEVTAESTVAVTAVESMEESLAGRRAATAAGSKAVE